MLVSAEQTPAGRRLGKGTRQSPVVQVRPCDLPEADEQAQPDDRRDQSRVHRIDTPPFAPPALRRVERHAVKEDEDQRRLEARQPVRKCAKNDAIR